MKAAYLVYTTRSVSQPDGTHNWSNGVNMFLLPRILSISKPYNDSYGHAYRIEAITG